MSIASGSLQKPFAGGQPCLTLVPVVKSDVDETELVQFTLKVRAGSAASAPTYKRKVARFNCGTPADWIAVLEALDEIFAQNSVVNAQDRENVIRTILRGDSWTAFESSIQESRINVVDLTAPLDLEVEMIDTALKAVTNDVFPHRALVNQLNWMSRRMRKPATMSIRQFVASVTQMNGHLVHFPGATNQDIFNPEKLLGLLEFSLPDAWRAKFDLAGYIPTLHDKTRLIMEGEQIERAAALTKVAAIKPKQHSAAAGKAGHKKNKSRKGNSNGPASASSPAVKHKPPAKGDSAVGKKFSGNKFRKELYALSKNKDRVKVIDQYAAVLEAERKKAVRRTAAVKKAKKSKEQPDTSSSEESDDDVSVHVMDAEEVRKERTEYVKNRLRATMQRLKKRRVRYTVGTGPDGTTGTGTGTTTTDPGTQVPGTTSPGTQVGTPGTTGTTSTTPTNTVGTTTGTKGTGTGTDSDQLEEEAAFNAQVNRSEMEHSDTNN